MKKVIIYSFLILFIGTLRAGIDQLAYIEAGKSAKSLWEEAIELSSAGLEVYYYNQAGFLVGLDSSKHQNLMFSKSLSYSDRLYLVSSLDGSAPELDGVLGSVILQLGSVSLLDCPWDAPTLRQKIKYPFVLLDFEPIKLEKTSMLGNPLVGQDAELLQMVSCVDADSVNAMIQDLQDFITRYALAPNRLEIAQWIRDKFLSFGISDVELSSFGFNNTTQYNVVATIQGSEFPDEYILVGGHHDSTNNHGDPYVSAPGADDNASGSVACLEMARVMMSSGFQPKRSIRFVTFAAEELGLFGSRSYAYIAEDTDMDIRLMINHDMIANAHTDYGRQNVRLMPYSGSLQHSLYAQRITANYSDLNAYFGELNSPSSDSHPFWQRGYNVIYFFESDFCPYYHSSDDIVANINKDYAAEVIKASTAVAASYANMPNPPTNFVVQDYGDGESLRLSWDASLEPNVSGYRLYWGESLSDLANVVDITQSPYVLGGLVQGNSYLFSLASVDASGNESFGSLSVGNPNLYPMQISEFYDLPKRNHVQLGWRSNDEYDLAGYKIYRSKLQGEPGTLLSTVCATDSSYLDYDVTGGLHYYYYQIQAFDDDGYMSPESVTIRSRPASMDQGVLIIDETLGMNGNSVFNPTNEMVDDFYDFLLEGFEPYQIDLEELDDALKYADIGVFSSILWHGNDQADMAGASPYKDILKAHIEQGGHVLFSVYHPSLEFEMNSSYPMSFPSGRFIHDILGISEVDYSSSSRFKTAIPLQNGYPLIEVDPLKSLGVLNYHINKVEGLRATDAATPIYSFGSDYADGTAQGYLNHWDVGLKNNYGDSKVITLSFPLYFMDADSAKEMVQYIFTHEFKKSIPDGDGTTPSAASLLLTPPQPNPFSQSMRVKLIVKDESKNTSVKIYNQKGQLLRTLLDGKAQDSQELSWDGRDDKGQKVSSGIYLIQAKQAKDQAIRKLLYLK